MPLPMDNCPTDGITNYKAASHRNGRGSERSAPPRQVEGLSMSAAAATAYELFDPAAPPSYRHKLVSADDIAKEIPSPKAADHIHPETLKAAFKRGDLRGVMRAGSLMLTRAWVIEWLAGSAEKADELTSPPKKPRSERRAESIEKAHLAAASVGERIRED
jgi:hypothetical protein